MNTSQAGPAEPLNLHGFWNAGMDLFVRDINSCFMLDAVIPVRVEVEFRSMKFPDSRDWSYRANTSSGQCSIGSSGSGSGGMLLPFASHLHLLALRLPSSVSMCHL